MNPSRAWTLGTIAAIAAILGGTAVLGVQPHLAAAAAADQSAQTAVAQNGATGIEITRLSRAAATESRLRVQNTTLESAVPPGLRMNSLSGLLRDAASLDGVTIQAFTPTTPILYAPPVSTVAPVAAAGATPAPSATPAATPAPAAVVAPVAPAAKSAWFGKTDPLVTPANFSVVPLSVTVKGSAAAVVAFATDAQRQTRLFAATTLTTTRSESDGSTTGVLAGYVYTLYQ